MTNTKAVKGESMATRLVGNIVESIGFFGSWVYPFFKSDSNLTCTVILNNLTAVASRRDGVLPPVLFLQMDNCGRENKNHTVFAFLASLILHQVFKEIYVHFLPVGHTHAKVDQRFSRISVKIAPMDLPTLPILVDRVEGNNTCCVALVTNLCHCKVHTTLSAKDYLHTLLLQNCFLTRATFKRSLATCWISKSILACMMAMITGW